MPRARWIVIGFLLAAGLVGAVLNERGPFGAHPSVSYAQYLADVPAGRVESIDRWRDRLEVGEGSELFLVTVPPQTDVVGDLARAAMKGGVGWGLQTIPDEWLSTDTPWVPLLILIAAASIWTWALARERRRRASDGSTGPAQPAT